MVEELAAESLAPRRAARLKEAHLFGQVDRAPPGDLVLHVLGKRGYLTLVQLVPRPDVSNQRPGRVRGPLLGG